MVRASASRLTKPADERICWDAHADGGVGPQVMPFVALKSDTTRSERGLARQRRTVDISDAADDAGQRARIRLNLERRALRTDIAAAVSRTLPADTDTPGR